MSLLFRTSGTWGSGKGINLTPSEVDDNFYQTSNRVLQLENNPVAPNDIQTISVTDNQYIIILNDGTQFGPFLLPTTEISGTNIWKRNHQYFAGQVIIVRKEPSYLYINETYPYIAFDEYFPPLEWPPEGPYNASQTAIEEYYYFRRETRQRNKAGKYLILKNHISGNGYFNSNLIINNEPVYLFIGEEYFLSEPINLTLPISLKSKDLVKYDERYWINCYDVTIENQQNLDNLIATGKLVDISKNKEIVFNLIREAKPYSISDAGGFLNYDYVQRDGYLITEIWLHFKSPQLLKFSGFTSYALLNNYIMTVKSDVTSTEFKPPNCYNLFSDFPSSYTNLGSRYLSIKPDETGIETVDPINTFLELADTPNTFSASNPIRVKSDETGLEYVSQITKPFTSLSDVPQTYSGSSNKYLKVNSNSNGVVFNVGSSGTSRLTYDTAKTPTSVTNVEFTNIPSSSQRIQIEFSGLKLSGSSDYVIQLGTSSSYTTSGYTTVYSYLRTSLNGSNGSIVSGFPLQGGFNANINHGYANLMLCDPATNLWVYNYCYSLIQSGNTYFTCHGAGSKSFGAGFVLNKLKVASSNNVDTFAAGTINISFD